MAKFNASVVVADADSVDTLSLLRLISDLSCLLDRRFRLTGISAYEVQLVIAEAEAWSALKR